MGRWAPLSVLALAQLLLVLDTAVMNVSISTLVEDLDTDVVAIQAVITAYSLVMAALMLIGGRLGERWGSRRAFAVGMAVYGVGSAVTAVAPGVGVLLVGWSVLEGAGAALALPSLVALVAGTYRDRDRAMAYGVLGAAAGIGVAVGPIVGGWVTTTLTWRLVFAGEVLLVLAILAGLRRLPGSVQPQERTSIDLIGAALSAVGLGLVVLAALRGSTWGWLRPRTSPVEPLGFAATPFVAVAGALLLVAFVSWQRRRERTGRDPLVQLRLLSQPTLRAGLATALAQNLLLLGLFFTLPLYLQLVLGMDPFETGLRLLPVSATLLVASLLGPRLAVSWGPRRVVGAGLGTILLASLGVLAVIQPQLASARFAVAMAVLGAGMGLTASQIGNIVQGSVEDHARSEAGGLQFTAQNLGSALGTALIGAVLLSVLTSATTTLVADDERLQPALRADTVTEVSVGVAFVDLDTVRGFLEQRELDPQEVDALLDDYAQAQLYGLRAALLAVAGLALAALGLVRRLPDAAGHQAGATPEEPDPSGDRSA